MKEKFYLRGLFQRLRALISGLLLELLLAQKTSSSTPLNPKVNHFQLSVRRVQLAGVLQFSMTELNADETSTVQTLNLDNVKPTIVACSHSDTTQKSASLIEELQDEELRKLLVPKFYKTWARSVCSSTCQWNAQHFESNTALCKACTNDASYVVRCCVKGSLLEVNDRLIKQPELLNSSADREGYIAIIMPRPTDWIKAKTTLLGNEEYRGLRKDTLRL